MSIHTDVIIITHVQFSPY